MPSFTPLISSLEAYPYNVGMAETFSYIPISTENRPLYAKAVYAVNGSDTGFTKGETKTSGDPSFVSQQILVHNSNSGTKNVILTLVSGMSCSVPIGPTNSANHTLLLNLAVSSVNNYDGCQITFFA